MIVALMEFALRPLAAVLNLLSPAMRAQMLMFLVRPMARRADPEGAIRFLFELDERLYALEGETSVRYGGGLHTKHRHINYHDFFVKNLEPGERVLDLGCGNGFLSFDMASRVEGVSVTGIELNEANYKYAREHYKHPKLTFVHGDALKDLPGESFDVVTLSNVLEHIELRVEFLRKVMERIGPKRFIIRVPVFERDWRVPLKKELGMDYRLDGTHFIEYTQEEFFDEIGSAGLKSTHTEFRWGELWCVALPEAK